MPRVHAPAPVGGWNARDSISLMPETDAITLDNFYPGRADVVVRNGFAEPRTGLTNNVETMMTYGGVTPEMFGIAGTSIFDVTAAGAVGAAVVTGLTNAQWQYTNFGTAGGHFIWLCNGVDAPYHYNGTNWVNPSLSGVTATDIVNVTAHHRRLFFVFNDSLAFGYLPVVSVAGAVSTFDLSSLFDLGGKLIAAGSWSVDGGAGPEDRMVFLTSNGEGAVYIGLDPASDWELIGTFKIGRPIGRRCLETVGGDLAVITDSGFVPMSQALPAGLSAPSVAFSNKIEKAVQEASALHKTKFGWQAVLYPQGGYGLFNVPVSNAGDFHQYVVNLTTGAWCRFTGQNGFSWVMHEGALFFGGAGTVFKADTGANDNGAAIEASGKTAFLSFGSPEAVKEFTMLRAVMGSDAELLVSIGFDVDYADGVSVFTPSPTSSPGSEWDTAEWDVAEWASSLSTEQAWRTVFGVGYNAAIRIRTSTTEQNVTWYGDTVIFNLGTGLT